MAEYIKTTDAITTTWMILRGMGYAEEDNPDMVKTVSAVFDTAPAADVVERKTGEWIPHKTKTGKNWWACSLCWFVSEHKAHHNFCPNCGAELRRSDNA